MTVRPTAHLSPVRHPPSGCQRWALLEEAGKPLIGRLGAAGGRDAERGQQRVTKKQKNREKSICSPENIEKGGKLKLSPLFTGNSVSCLDVSTCFYQLNFTFKFRRSGQPSLKKLEEKKQLHRQSTALNHKRGTGFSAAELKAVINITA